MKHALFVAAAVCCCLAARACAGTGPIVETNSKNSGPIVQINPETKLSYEFDLSETYVGEGDVVRDTGRLGNFHVDDFDENDFLARFVLTPRTKIGILRLGFAYERWDFGFDDFEQVRTAVLTPAFVTAEIPNRLQAANFVVGLDSEFSDSLVFRIEAHPGWYGARGNLFDGDNFRVPFIFGGSYIFSENFQVVVGIGVNFEGDYRVLPGGGIRWRIADGWRLNAVMPNPRLEYQPMRYLTIYAGANIEAETFRTNDRFGTERGNPKLDNAWMDYTEVRTGLGLEWRLANGITLALEGGYQPYRQFYFSNEHVRYHEDGGAPYASGAIHLAF